MDDLLACSCVTLIVLMVIGTIAFTIIGYYTYGTFLGCLAIFLMAICLPIFACYNICPVLDQLLYIFCANIAIRGICVWFGLSLIPLTAFMFWFFFIVCCLMSIVAMLSKL